MLDIVIGLHILICYMLILHFGIIKPLTQIRRHFDQCLELLVLVVF